MVKAGTYRSSSFHAANGVFCGCIKLAQSLKPVSVFYVLNPSLIRNTLNRVTLANLDRPRIVAVLRGDSKVTGTVTFEQADEHSETTISWDISGHDANAERGFHIHTFGDNTNGCTSAGPHCRSPTPCAA